MFAARRVPSTTVAGIIRRCLATRRTVAELSSRLAVATQPTLSDNYSYLAADLPTNRALVVDPGEASPLTNSADELGWTLGGVLVTHHHADHVGGLDELLSAQPGLRVWASDPRLRQTFSQVELLKHGEEFEFESLRVTCLHTPGHTRGHCAFDVRETNLDYRDKGEDDSSDNRSESNSSNGGEDDAVGALFAGDTLFVGGCGRLFEGTASEMYHSLFDVIFKLPKRTLLFCGHEYTEANIRFALSIEPENGRLSEMAGKVAARRDQQLPTVPSLLHDEFRHNPFARCRERAMAKRLGFFEWSEHDRDTHIAVLQQLRDMKDKF